MSQVLDSLEEITCLTDCTVGEAEFLEDVLQDTRLHNLLNVSTERHIGWAAIENVNPSPVALFLSTNTAVAELIFKIYLFIPTKIKNS